MSYVNRRLGDKLFGKTRLDAIEDKVSLPDTPTNEHYLKPYGYTGASGKVSDDYMSKVDNDFSYNVYGSALYNQYKDQYTRNAQLGMEDAMGKAAALTGGYGNSYAQTVGQQAYYNQMEGLNDVAMQLYQMAYNQWQNDRDHNLKMADFYNTMDQQELANALAIYEAENKDPEYALTDYGKVPDSIRTRLEEATTNEALQAILDGYVASNYMSPQVGGALFNEYGVANQNYQTTEGNPIYSGMLNDLGRWGMYKDGGFNWWGGADTNATVITPLGEKIKVKTLIDNLVKNENMDKKEAEQLVIALLEHLGIND